MEGWRGKTAVVTGANSEIGKAVSQMLLDYGINVVGTDHQETSEELKGQGNYYYKPCLVSSEDQVWDLFLWIEENFEGADILINNINFMQNQTILNGEKKKWHEMSQNNILGCALFGKEFLRSMSDRVIEIGHIINISSFYGHHVPLDSSLAYFAATKNAANHLNSGLRDELQRLDSKVKVTIGGAGNYIYGFLYKVYPELIMHQSISPRSGVTPQDIAEAIRYSLDTPFHQQVHDVVLEPFEEYE